MRRWEAGSFPWGPGLDSKSSINTCQVEDHIPRAHLEWGMHHLDLEYLQPLHPWRGMSLKRAKPGPLHRVLCVVHWTRMLGREESGKCIQYRFSVHIVEHSHLLPQEGRVPFSNLDKVTYDFSSSGEQWNKKEPPQPDRQVWEAVGRHGGTKGRNLHPDAHCQAPPSSWEASLSVFLTQNLSSKAHTFLPHS